MLCITVHMFIKKIINHASCSVVLWLIKSKHLDEALKYIANVGQKFVLSSSACSQFLTINV